MNDQTIGKVHWSFWVISVIALIWNAMGVINFFMQMNADALAAMPESQRAIIVGRPVWATAAFAIAVFGGALGCFLLLLRKPTATYLFIGSLLGMIVHMIPYLGMTGSTIKLGPVEILMFILMPLAVAVFLIWYSKQTQSKGWINTGQRVPS
ncbi:MAG: hypothetical protein HY080_15265 [Gammaproteobacteria bacterium]|nr:hypothetical protein [Gammaproteobacteria bacterium]